MPANLKQTVTACAGLAMSTLAAATALADETVPSDGLAEIMVTARRQQENLQTVPISITALSEETLRQSRVTSFADLQVPSMVVTSPWRDGFFVSIRGHGGYSPGSGPAVITYFNEVPLPPSRSDVTAGGGPGTFYDLQSVQILKGPQGTLFGRNTTGGAVLFESRRPKPEFGGYLQVGIGSYNDRSLQGAVDLPIVGDTLYARLALNTQKRDGFTHVAATPGHPEGSDIDNRDFLAGRATLTYKPNDRFQNDLIYDGIDSDEDSPSNLLVYVDPNGLAAKYFPAILQSLQQQALDPRHQIALNTDQKSRKRTTSVIDLARLKLTDGLTLRNIVSYSSQTFMQAIDADGSPQPVFALMGTSSPYRAEYYTEELQLQGTSFDDKLTWSAGGFYVNSPTPDYMVAQYTTLGSKSLSVTRQSENSHAIYAQGTYDLSALIDGLKVTAGARQSWDHRFAQNRGLNASGACVAPAATADATCTTTRSGDFSAPTWNFTLDYRLTQQTMAYFATRRGYRTGGFNTIALDTQRQSFDPEYVTDQEVGLKSDWNIGGMRARTDLAVYHQNYSSIQLSQNVLQNGKLQSVVSNGGDARIWGGEFEASIFPTEHLELGVNASFLSFKYTSFGEIDATAVNAAQAAADKAAILATSDKGRPPSQYGVNARYHLPVDSRLGEISLGANWSWQAFSGDRTFHWDGIPAYDLLSVNAAWNGIRGTPLDALLVVTNVTNNDYVVGGYGLKTLGYATWTYGEPRMFSLKLQYHFGG